MDGFIDVRQFGGAIGHDLVDDANDPLFVDKVLDIVGLYTSPPNRAFVLCVDEKSPIQALDREQPVLPMAPGVPERRTHTYLRNGTTSLFAALDVSTGAVIGKCYKGYRASEFLDFLKRIDVAMPEGPEVHLVMDNCATHKTPKIKQVARCSWNFIDSSSCSAIGSATKVPALLYPVDPHIRAPQRTTGAT